jgi:hypothetical protein
MITPNRTTGIVAAAFRQAASTALEADNTRSRADFSPHKLTDQRRYRESCQQSRLHRRAHYLVSGDRVADSACLPAGEPEPGEPAQLRFRASRRQALMIGLPFCLIAAVVAGDFCLTGQPAVTGSSSWLYGLVLVMIAAAMCLQARFGATLTPEGVIVHGLRRKTIAWPDVTAIRAEEYTTNRVVAIYEFGHRRTRLRYPVSGGLFRDSEFDEKLGVIQDWWAASTRCAVT